MVAESQPVVVIERDADNRYLAQARALGVPVVIADATQSQTHRMVNSADAKAVAVLTSGGLQGLAMQDLSTRTRVIAPSRAAGGALEHPPRRGTAFPAGTVPSCSAPTRSSSGCSSATRRPCSDAARHHGAP
jgi:hypothetical protein